MKQVKKIIALALAVTLLLSGTTTANAATKTSAEKLYELGLLLDVTDKGLAMNINRALGLTMVLKAIGYTQEDANAKVAANTFTDMKGYEWATGFAAIGKEVGITTGADATGTKFAPSRTMTKKEFITFMLRVVGYDGKQAWDMTGTLGKKAGLINSTNVEDNNFIKNEAAEIMFNTLSAELQNMKNTRLVDKLVKENKVKRQVAVAVGLIEEPTSLQLVKVEADNLRQVTIAFNKALDKQTAEKAANYYLRGYSLSEAKLSDDGKVITLTVGSGNSPVVLKNQREIELTIKTVKDTSGKTLSNIKQKFIPFDGTLPKVESVTVAGPRSLKVMFDEPIKTFVKANVTVKSDGKTTVSVREAKVDEGNDKMGWITLYSDLKEANNYTVTIVGVKDYAGYTNFRYEETLDYADNKTAPTATVVSANQKMVVVEFDKPVKGLTKEHFYHSFSAYTARKIFKDAAMKQEVKRLDAVSKVWVQFATGTTGTDRPLQGDVVFTIRAKNSAGSVIKDAWGNEFATRDYKVSVAADKEAPKIVSIEVKSGRKVEVTYNEELYRPGIYRLLDDRGNLVSSTSVSYNGKVVTLNFGSDQQGKTRRLEIKGVKDASLNHNELDKTLETVTFSDSEFKGVNKIFAQFEKSAGSIVGGKIFVSYLEDVDSSATERANYTIQYKAGDQIVPTEDINFHEGSGRMVALQLTKEQAQKLNNNKADAQLFIANVKDTSGNSILTTVKKIDFEAQQTTVKKIKLITSNQLAVEYDEKINEVGAASTFTVNGGGFNVGYEDGKQKGLVKVVDASINDGAVVLTLNYDVYSVDGGTVSSTADSAIDVLGNKALSFSSKEVETDEVKPILANKKDGINEGENWVEATKSGSNYLIKLHYTEKIKDAALSTLTYSVNSDFTINSISSSNTDVVTITMTPNTGADFAADVNITQSYEIQDINGNSKSAGDSYTAIKDSSWK